ncbi:hypothetical protein [Desulfallas thermosapovorans]|uniref:Uncharacterized protein n=1 Tax=Desulfallas thermosapovorans DSM 6562 TaxID=1121431 RepID=A0A5S4ZS74_9FIRM|nr:hypothetical protein [Desulfallas thermosapovorans]TYO95498.1 hypothetical protein LX24_01459 [Desulfallas thermosapovorans DSM 6562]
MITNIERTLDEMRKQALLQGKIEGKAEGRAEGIAEGIAKGIAEGKFEGKVETARAALMEGLNVEIVSKITGLTLDTVLELKKELKN